MAPHRRRLKRIEVRGHVRFLTCSCYQRLPLFRNDLIKEAFADHLSAVKDEMGFNLYAWVLMPEHLHLLILPTRTVGVTAILRGLKAPFARRVIRRWRELKAPVLKMVSDGQGAFRFWQRGGGYDRNVVSDREMVEKIDYIHSNPVRRGLVKRPSEWRWSSAAVGGDAM